MKVLFIPHTPNNRIVNRVYELAKVSDGYALHWYMDKSSFTAKIRTFFTLLFQPIRVRDDRLVVMPILFKPDGLARRFNAFMLNRVVRRYGFDIVVNANALLFDVAKISVPVVYDLVDDHLEPNKAIGLTDARVRYVRRDIAKSSAVTCVSDALLEKVRRYNPRVSVVENGLYLERFAKAHSLKEALGLSGKKVFGYIGGVEAWTGIDKALDAYEEIKSPSTAMLVVGDSKSGFFSALKKRYAEDVLFTGLIPPEAVGNYFKTIDVGLIPFELNAFTNNAYPIKAFEYGLAGAAVLSTPLAVLQQKKLPFITFCPITAFADCMSEVEKGVHDYDFSELSWEHRAEQLMRVVKDVLEKSSKGLS